MVKKLYNFIRIIIFGIFYFIKGSILFADELQDISLTDDTLKATINQETYEFDVLSNDDFVPPDSELVILQKNPKCGKFQINENKIIYILNNTCNEEFEENYFKIDIVADYINLLNFLRSLQEYKMIIIPICFEPSLLSQSSNLGQANNPNQPGFVRARIMINVPTTE